MNAIRIKTLLESAQLETMELIKTWVKTHCVDGIFDADKENFRIEIPNWGEESESSNNPIISIDKDGIVIDSDENSIELVYFPIDFLLEILEELEKIAPVFPIVNENPEPSFQLIEKFAFVKGYRFENTEDHKDAKNELVELLKTGKITEKEILDAYENDDTIN